jgi:hypothetical protein
MTVWQLTTGLSDQVATLVIPEADQTLSVMKRFGGDGSTLAWRKPLRLETDRGGRKKPRPLGDVGPFLPGALVLGEKAHDALGPFLARFGQLLELDVDGVPHWFYNVTHLVSCIDRERSEQRAGGTIGKEAFIDSAVPAEASVFKDPATARARIYVNEKGRRALEDAAALAGVRGLKFLHAGLAQESA